MKNRFFMLLPLMIVTAASNAEVTRILSPNGLTYVDVELKDGHLMYSAGYRQVATLRVKATGVSDAHGATSL